MIGAVINLNGKNKKVDAYFDTDLQLKIVGLKGFNYKLIFSQSENAENSITQEINNLSSDSYEVTVPKELLQQPTGVFYLFIMDEHYQPVDKFFISYEKEQSIRPMLMMAESMDIAVSTINYLVIDEPTRKINIPLEETVFGTEYEKDAEEKYFKMQRYVDNNIDLSKFTIQVVYQNAKQEIGKSVVKDIRTTSDEITFKWVLPASAVGYTGTINFLVKAVKTDSRGKELIVWSTTVAQGTVLKGLNDGDIVLEPADKDTIAQFMQELENAKNKALDEIKQAGGGTTNYADLINKPKINGVELNGDVASEQLGISVGTGLTQAQIDALDGLFKVCAYVTNPSIEYQAFKDAFAGGGILPPPLPPVPEGYFSITNRLANVKSSNTTTSVVKNSNYKATLTADSGYKLDVVTVEMGGIDITSTAYKNGNINIANVTGNVVITARAITDGEIINMERDSVCALRNGAGNAVVLSPTTFKCTKGGDIGLYINNLKPNTDYQFEIMDEGGNRNSSFSVYAMKTYKQEWDVNNSVGYRVNSAIPNPYMFNSKNFTSFSFFLYSPPGIVHKVSLKEVL